MERLYLGIKGHVVCINQATGDKLWETKLKSTSGITNLLLDGNNIFAYTSGHLYCLDAKLGNVKWENKLPGLGYGSCILASSNQNAAVIAAQAAAQGAAVAGSTVAVTASSS